jgi:hypothetical protein
MLTGPLLALVIAGSHPRFPIPADKGKAEPDPAGDTFRVEQPLGRLEHFYRAEFKGDVEVSFLKGTGEKGDTLTIVNASKHDDWTKAVLRGDDITTTIHVTQVVKPGPVNVGGSLPMVVFVPRSGQVEQQLKQIDAEHAPTH